MVATLFIVFFSYETGNRYFGDPDEGRYVEIPREMVVSGDYITPRLNGLKYFEKPALFYWMQAAAIHTLGINETTMRIWPIIFAILGCLTVFFIGYKYEDREIKLKKENIDTKEIVESDKEKKAKKEWRKFLEYDGSTPQEKI